MVTSPALFATCKTPLRPASSPIPSSPLRPVSANECQSNDVVSSYPISVKLPGRIARARRCPDLLVPLWKPENVEIPEQVVSLSAVTDIECSTAQVRPALLVDIARKQRPQVQTFIEVHWPALAATFGSQMSERLIGWLEYLYDSVRNIVQANPLLVSLVQFTIWEDFNPEHQDDLVQIELLVRRLLCLANEGPNLSADLFPRLRSEVTRVLRERRDEMHVLSLVGSKKSEQTDLFDGHVLAETVSISDS